LTLYDSKIKSPKQKNVHISLVLAQNEKIIPLYFVKLLKLKKIKWSYFFILSQNKRDMGIFLIFTFQPKKATKKSLSFVFV